MEARSPADLVRQALDSELGPDDIDRLVRDPSLIVDRLKAVYEGYEHPPLPRRHQTTTRPLWTYGRESSGSHGAPADRTAVALNALIYHHEVVIRDPVEWFLYHDHAQHDRHGALEMLHSFVQLMPLIDQGLVRCISDRMQHPRVPWELIEAVTLGALGQALGPDIDRTSDVLDQILMREELDGSVDILTAGGGPDVYGFLQQTLESALHPNSVPMATRRTSIIVPNIEQVLSSDLVSLRQSDLFGQWQQSLREAMHAFEEVNRHEVGSAHAHEAFLDILSGPASRLEREVRASSWLAAVRRGVREISIGLTGAIAVLTFGIEPALTEAFAVLTAGGAHALVAGWSDHERHTLLTALARHYESYLIDTSSAEPLKPPDLLTAFS